MEENLQQSATKQLKEVAQRIKQTRNLLGISIEEMAGCTGVSEKDYVEYEKGTLDFNFTFIYKCAHAFGVDPTDLLKGSSPTLTGYEVTRKGGGLPITRRTGYEYKNLAAMFKNKVTEPFWVKIPYDKEEEENPKVSKHEGQEFDIVIKGRMKAVIDGNVEILEEGDSIYYNSTKAHGLAAMDGQDVEIYAMVMGGGETETRLEDANATDAMRDDQPNTAVYKKFISTVKDKGKRLVDISFKNENKFNFAFDCVDRLAEKCPDKMAMMYVSNDKQERKFTFKEISEYSSKTANYFESLGIKKGDKVMLVLKRHYQFWFSILALHKIGAVVIPATNQLVQHDFEYRFKAGEVSAIVCTSDGDVSNQVDLAIKDGGFNITKIMVGENKEGWDDFNSKIETFSCVYDRKRILPAETTRCLCSLPPVQQGILKLPATVINIL